MQRDRGRYGAHTVQLDVRDFHREVCEVEPGETPAIRRPQLRASLIEEEATELINAIRGGDLVAAIDGMCDLLCVVYGTADEFGVDLAPFWDEVHRTNMAKAGGPVREDGKRLEPEGWTPPDIAGLLERLTEASAHGADAMSLLDDPAAVERAALVLWFKEMAWSDNVNHRKAVHRRWNSATEAVRESYRHGARKVIAAAEGKPAPPRDLMRALSASLKDASTHVPESGR